MAKTKHSNISDINSGTIIIYGAMIAIMSVIIAGIGMWSIASSKASSTHALLKQIDDHQNNYNIKHDIVSYAIMSNLMNIDLECDSSTASLEEFIQSISGIQIPCIQKEGECLTIVDLAAYMSYASAEKRYQECMLYFSVNAIDNVANRKIDNSKFVNMINDTISFDSSKFYSQCNVLKVKSHEFHLKYLFALYKSMACMYNTMPNILMQKMRVACPAYLEYYCSHILCTAK